MTRFNLFLFAIILMLLTTYKPAIKPGDLYGKWKYIKVEHPDDPTDSVRSTDIAYQAPYIQFSANNEVVMIWGGKVLSHGKFTTDGQNIKIKEELPDGTKREFPFWVMSLTEKQIVFETTNGADKSRVTAVRVNQ